MKTALIVRHVEREGAAAYLTPMEAAGYRIERLNVAEPGAIDTCFLDPDLLVVMGGPMGVYERHLYPWIGPEIEKIAKRIERNRPTLGVCLGAQMVAAAMGAQVYRGPQAEVGFVAITLNEEAAQSPLRHLHEVPVLHWHSDTFDLPRGAELLASTSGYPHQAFRRGANVLALQFHAEMGEDPRFEIWLDHFREDFGCCPQREAALRSDYAAHGPAAVAAGRAMVAQWLSEIEPCH